MAVANIEMIRAKMVSRIVKKIVARRTNLDAMSTFGDFGARVRCVVDVIFLLTSDFVDSIQSNSCN
jgi:hypothetical protein